MHAYMYVCDVAGDRVSQALHLGQIHALVAVGLRTHTRLFE